MNPHRATRFRPGFTLIEILIVIAIIAVLMTIGVIAMGRVENRKKEETAKVTISALATALDRYHSDYSYYPVGDGSETSSNLLYAAIYCDEDGDGRPDPNPEGQGRLKPYWDQLKPGATDSSSVNVKKFQGKYCIIDPWGKPYRYRLGFNAYDEQGNKGTGLNPDCDIWSLGSDQKGNGGSNKTGDNKDNIANW